MEIKTNILDHGKTPPQAVELEEAVLGAIMITKDAILDVIDILKPESFYKEKNQIVYSAILRLNERSEPIDILTVTNQLKSEGHIKSGILSPYEITKLTNSISSSSNLEYHARIVEQMSIKRSMINTSSEVITKAYDDTVDTFELAEYWMTKSYELNDIKSGRQMMSNSELLLEAKKKIEHAKSESGITGIPTGFNRLDAIYGGYKDTHLIIKAGRPAMGKTAHAICEASFMAHHRNKKVLFFSLEMSALELTNRLIAVESGIFLSRMDDGNMRPEDWKAYNEAGSLFLNNNLTIIDIPSLSLNQLRKIAKKKKMKEGVDIIYIDYLQLMENPIKGGSREQEISAISRGLKGLAKELNIPVISLAQLSRAVESRGGAKKPILADLRESGSIEQDADSVQFLYRPEYYGITHDDDGNSTSGIAYVMIAKNRHGAVKDIPLSFIPQLTKFDNLTEDKTMYNPNEGISPNYDWVRDPTESNQRDNEYMENNNDDEPPF